MLLNDKQIIAALGDRITPFHAHKVRARGGNPVLSYGLEPAGYTLSLSDAFIFIREGVYGTIDPKMPVVTLWQRSHQEWLDVQPQQSVLACSAEYISMPDTLAGMVTGKSTYARCGLLCYVTTIEPGWEGQLTIELFNASRLPVRVYAHEGICQIHFYRIETPGSSYEGKYQGQTGVTLGVL
jgi:dCTP deaminase